MPARRRTSAPRGWWWPWCARTSTRASPRTFGIYVLLETFRWLEKQGGLAAMEQRNEAKARLLYDAIDGSGGYFTGTVAVKEQRSRMNVTFRLPTPELDD